MKNDSPWGSRLDSIAFIDGLAALPSYAFQFVFRNLGGFRLTFAGLTGAAVLSSVLRFIVVALLADLITHIATMSVERVLQWYLPAFVLVSTAKETIDYLLRRHGEPFPHVFSGHMQLRFYRTFLDLRSHRLLNASKERLQGLVEKYVGHVNTFLADWLWGTTRKITQLVIVLGILWHQSLAILAFNLVYIAVFLALSFGISRRFSAVARVLSEHMIETQSVRSRAFLHMDTVKRLRAAPYFMDLLSGLTAGTWEKLDDAYAFHARRWLLQLVLFNLLYIGTLVAGVLQVIEGDLPLGYLVLIKYAFDNLWEILTYAIEYYVSLITQKEDTAIIRRDLLEILGPAPALRETCELGDWQELRLQHAEAVFHKESGAGEVRVHIPQFMIRRGDRIGVIGESGAGKSTLLNMLLGLVPFSGELTVDGRSIKGREPSSGDVVFVNAADPFFNLSLADNLFLGRTPDPQHVQQVLRGLCIDAFACDLSVKFGAPGVHFSAGQEQRLRLARAVFQTGSFYLLDEPFNGIDADTKAEVMAFMAAFLRDRTVLLVTHNADELALVRDVYEFHAGVLMKRE